MTAILPITKGSNITVVNDLGVATKYVIIKAELVMHQTYDLFQFSFVDYISGASKNLSLYADQIEVFNTETEEIIDIYDLG